MIAVAMAEPGMPIPEPGLPAEEEKNEDKFYDAQGAADKMGGIAMPIGGGMLEEDSMRVVGGPGMMQEEEELDPRQQYIDKMDVEHISDGKERR